MKPHTEQREVSEELHRYQGYDPIRAAEREAPTLNTRWLKNGESQTLLQKVGFTIFSLFWFAAGLFIASWCADEGRDGDIFWFLFSGAGAAFFLIFGVLGLRNVLRFKRDESR